jgi:hypothetical protein
MDAIVGTMNKFFRAVTMIVFMLCIAAIVITAFKTGHEFCALIVTWMCVSRIEDMAKVIGDE